MASVFIFLIFFNRLSGLYICYIWGYLSSIRKRCICWKKRKCHLTKRSYNLVHPQGAFSGNCIIFGTAALQGSTVIVKTFGSSSACRFPLTASIFTAIYCFSNVAYWAFSACMGQVHRLIKAWTWATLEWQDDLCSYQSPLFLLPCTVRSRGWSSWEALFLSVLARLVLTAACELRSGLGYFCSTLLDVSHLHPLKKWEPFYLE